MAKLTFSLDEETVERLRNAARRSRKPQSLVVREAIAHYTAQDARLDDEERQRLLGVLRRIRARPDRRATADVDGELREIRRSRRTGWSRGSR